MEAHRQHEHALDGYSVQFTGRFCAVCGEELGFDEFVDGWRMCRIVWNEEQSQLELCPVLDTNGHPALANLWFHNGCYEEIKDALTEIQRDEPPYIDLDECFSCDQCGGSIGVDEHVVEIMEGTFAEGKRGLPSLERTTHNNVVWCVPCINEVTFIGEIINDGWAELSEHGECHLCMKGRCWKNEKTTCKCGCHRP